MVRELDEKRFKEVLEKFREYLRSNYSKNTVYTTITKVRRLYEMGVLTENNIDKVRRALREHGYYDNYYVLAYRKFNAFLKHHLEDDKGLGERLVKEEGIGYEQR